MYLLATVMLQQYFQRLFIMLIKIINVIIITADLCINESNTGFDIMLTSRAVFILKHIFHLLLFYVQLSRVTVFCDTLMPFSSRAGSTSSYISRVTGMTTPFSVILPTKETTNISNDENK